MTGPEATPGRERSSCGSVPDVCRACYDCGAFMQPVVSVRGKPAWRCPWTTARRSLEIDESDEYELFTCRAPYSRDMHRWPVVVPTADTRGVWWSSPE